jgi:hypothetical protein
MREDKPLKNAFVWLTIFALSTRESEGLNDLFGKMQSLIRSE